MQKEKKVGNIVLVIIVVMVMSAVIGLMACKTCTQKTITGTPVVSSASV